MATTPLRLYLHDIEGMVGAGQMEEAVAHCRHILETYPKSIAVYRLLGKAYLENQRYSDAADVFQRVLSAMPDDFVSHVGMSIIREDEGNMDASIWHMERAFETQPYNSAIQEELRRLYGRRDGMEPPKMRLTRGALARLYVKGDLYQQAIGELRAALAEDPQRPDLQALLARVYYMAGQRIEAVETCSTLLKKLPYCLDANILLGAILPETERAQDAQNYRQRAMALEPYFSQAPSNAQTADNVPINAITVEKLLYTPGAAGPTETGQPAWATSLGVAFTEEKGGEALPEWLSTPAGTTLPSEEGATEGGVSPFSEGETPGSFPWEPPSEEATPSEAEPAAADTIPEWMKDAGWAPATGEAKEGPMPLNLEQESTIPPAEGEIAPADIPDWLREAAPPGVLEPTPTIAEEKSTEEVLPWLQENPPGPSDTIITWLSSTKGEETPSPSEEGQPVPPGELPQQLEPEGVSPKDLGGLTEAVEAEIPDWLKEIPPTEKPEIATETTGVSELPDWMKAAETTEETEIGKETADWLKGSEAEIPAVSAELPDWLTRETPEEGTPTTEMGQLAPSEEELPEWLKAGPATTETPTLPEIPTEATPTEVMPAETAPVEVAPSEIVPSEAPPTTAPTAAEEFPEWLKEVEAEIPEEAIETPQITGVTEWLDTVSTGDLATGPVGITDWLKKVEAGEVPTSAEPGPSAVDIFPWMREEKEEGTGEISAEQSIPPAVPAEELPEWMREIQAGIPVTGEPEAQGSGTVEVQEAAAGEERGTVETGLEGIIPPTEEAVLGESTPAFEGELPAGLDLTDQDAALAWLEGLAAKQGVPEEELISKPEERLETPSAWVQETVEEVQTTPAEVPAVPAEELPEWLKAAVTEVEEAVIPEVQEMASVEVSKEVGEKIPGEVVVPPGEATTIAEVAEPVTTPSEAAPVEIPSQPTEWIKETELPEWLEKTELPKAVEKAESEAELPGWISEATEQEPEIAWEPPKILDHAEIEKADEHKRTNLNNASVGELERLPGIGFVLAQSIINHRAARGPFTSIDDLLDVPGIGPGTIEVLKNWITIQPVKTEITEEIGPPLDPDHIILRQAHNALHQGDILTAITQYEELLSRLVLLNEIILDLQDALHRYPVEISIWQVLGDAYMRNNQLQDALDAYTKAEELLR
jgi:competence ComEA-like helix-hairpin-helix protein